LDRKVLIINYWNALLIVFQTNNKYNHSYFSMEECKRAWKNLKDSFAEKLRKSKTGKSGNGLQGVADAEKAKKWLSCKTYLLPGSKLHFLIIYFAIGG